MVEKSDVLDEVGTGRAKSPPGGVYTDGKLLVWPPKVSPKSDLVAFFDGGIAPDPPNPPNPPFATVAVPAKAGGVAALPPMSPPDCALVAKTALGDPVGVAGLAVFPAPVLVIGVLDVHLANGFGDSAAAFGKLGPNNALPNNPVPGGAFEAASVVSCAPGLDGMVTGTVRDCIGGSEAA